MTATQPKYQQSNKALKRTPLQVIIGIMRSIYQWIMCNLRNYEENVIAE